MTVTVKAVVVDVFVDINVLESVVIVFERVVSDVIVFDVLVTLVTLVFEVSVVVVTVEVGVVVTVLVSKPSSTKFPFFVTQFGP